MSWRPISKIIVTVVTIIYIYILRIDSIEFFIHPDVLELFEAEVDIGLVSSITFFSCCVITLIVNFVAFMNFSLYVC